eukprot:CAMPEP_0172509196 /NCGR_PEP_ID=MMETSP1066-20121228/218272_1 /TAXON_ID=671091 /ORGANISM="Coscinodiscus wailesii, Strain CCMP2513" /LENGTH=274 /DNA_ID=CAMNT_0013287569 /DNA_START=131 /DNA_END=952 /DNA_ORIENTATION=+
MSSDEINLQLAKKPSSGNNNNADPTPSDNEYPTPANGDGDVGYNDPPNQAPSLIVPGGPVTKICNSNNVCSRQEDCQNCPSDCQRHARKCGDGKCVDGENCQNCPQDCNGNLDDAGVMAEEQFCCGFGDGIDDEGNRGCGHSECNANGFKCIGNICKGSSTRRCDAMVCGDGKCVEGENCNNCPEDCNGNLGTSKDSGNSSESSSEDLFCCGYDDGIAPDGCEDSRCAEGSFSCLSDRESCDGTSRFNKKFQDPESGLPGWNTFQVSMMVTCSM